MPRTFRCVLVLFVALVGAVILTPEGRAAVTAAWQSVQAGHDEMRDLKHALQA